MATQIQIEIEVHNVILDEIKVQNEIEVSTNLWIPLSHHMCSHIQSPGTHHL